MYFLPLALSLGAAAYLAGMDYLLDADKQYFENEISKLGSDFGAATEKLDADIRNIATELEKTKNQLVEMTAQKSDFEAKYNDEKNRMDSFNSQISDIQGTVSTLEKIKATDPELLKKYSKVYFLNENYTPQSFAKIEPDYTYNPKEDYLIHSKVWPFLKNMMAAAKEEGIDIKIISSYRSFGAQSVLKSSYKMYYGTGANKFSADQGYSEHQLGTTVDFTTSTVGASFDNFDKTPAYQWLMDNAYEYGFIASYPPGNNYYQYEPWHWRFVGRALAQKLHADGKNFYDLDQRDIDQYRATFFD